MTSSHPAAAPSPVVDLRGVTVNLASAAGTVNVLRGLDLTAYAGERLGVVGPSGSGKTTMMMVAAGLERAASGVVRVAGEDLTVMNEDQLAAFRRRRLGVVFQSFHLIPTMTALENVAVPLEFAGRADAMERARAGLARVGLSHRLDHYPGQLSGGEQQRVAVARAFVGEPDLLLADEPTGNLDAATGEVVIDLLFDLATGHGTTLVLITHDERLAARCDRKVTVKDGRVIDNIAADAGRFVLEAAQ
jgi:putative ABC transport system ATP-binding protein